MANRIVEELIKKSKAASINNRGVYPVTAASNVFKQDGTPLEKVTENVITPDIPEPDVVVDPTTTPVTEIIASIESGAIVAVADGEVAEELNLNKGIVLQGVNAGIPQNYKQEV